MATQDLTDWLNEWSKQNIIWYAKRLSGNDTLANGTHQAGLYIPREFLFSIFPSLNRPDLDNPDKWFELRIDSHGDVRQARAIWYNNRLRRGTRNETRITNFGGAASALLDPDSTGALAIFTFERGADGEAASCNVWVCDHETDEDIVEARIGPVEPGKFVIWSFDDTNHATPTGRTTCWLEPNEISPAWLLHFPTGSEIVRKAVELQPGHGIPIDVKLMQRRKCEYEIFRSLEEAVELPIIRAGFTSIDEFVSRAQSILQRRKSRSGRSLELHTREIFIEEAMQEGRDFAHQPESEDGKKPDFLFPSQEAYRDLAFPTAKLRMLATKTTVKERWRQIINEADRIQDKHLLTLQEGVSEGQFREMTAARVHLVVPQPLIRKYPTAVQPYLQTLESFIGDLRVLNPV